MWLLTGLVTVCALEQGDNMLAYLGDGELPEDWGDGFDPSSKPAHFCPKHNKR